MLLSDGGNERDANGGGKEGERDFPEQIYATQMYTIHECIATQLFYLTPIHGVTCKEHAFTVIMAMDQVLHLCS